MRAHVSLNACTRDDCEIVCKKYNLISYIFSLRSSKKNYNKISRDA